MEESKKDSVKKPDGILAGLGLTDGAPQEQAGKKSDLSAEVNDRLHGKMGSVKQQLGAAKDIVGFAGS